MIPQCWKKSMLVSFIIFYSFPSVLGQILKLERLEGQQCVGIPIDESRLQSLEDEDVSNMVDEAIRGEDAFDFITRDIHQVRSFQRSECIAERHRVQERFQGIPILGADFVVTTSACSETSEIERSDMIDTNTLAIMDTSSVTSTAGYKVDSIDVTTGYEPQNTMEDMQWQIAKAFETAKDQVTTLSLQIYPTADRDCLAWVGTVFANNELGEPQLYYVVVDDVTMTMLYQCEIDGYGSDRRQELIRRRAQIRHRHRMLHDKDHENKVNHLNDKSVCDVCEKERIGYVDWDYNDVVECETKTLYMNNTGRTSLCITGKDMDGNTYVAPGRIDRLFFNGTYDCQSRGGSCKPEKPLPDCNDGVNDVHWGSINFLQYIRDHLGVMGGIARDASKPVSIVAKVHYGYKYCNAFFLPGESAVTFGDCDCEIFAPLVSSDVVVHEITHGLTYESSRLIYFGQSGGMNEAYSDIMATGLEFYINDEKDKPDFLVGESLSVGSEFLRNMEEPSTDGHSIDDYCGYEGAMVVHFSSGFLNRAYVGAVRECQSTCDTEANCAILMSNLFMYTNMESLCMLSGFRDAAKHTCRDVDEFFEARNPQTSCSVKEIRSAVTAGFSHVGLRVNKNTCWVWGVSCKRQGPFKRISKTFQNLFGYAKLVCGALWRPES